MARTDTLHIRVDPAVKTGVDATLSPLGLSITEAVNIFLHQVLLVGGLPFEVRQPHYNAETLAAVQEARDMSSGKLPAKRFTTVAALMEDLTNDADD